jgi:transposase
VLEPQLPRGKKPGRPPERTKRQLIDGIRWRTRTGAPWRDVPPVYGPWQTVYGLFRRWQRNGTWRAILTALQCRAGAAGLITWDVSVDSTVARAHQHAAGARKRGDLQAEPPGGVQDEPADHGLGRSRGGLTTKIHLACEQRQKPLSVVITAGQRGDSPQFQVVPGRIRVPRPGRGRPRTRPDRVLADKANPGAHPPRSRAFDVGCALFAAVASRMSFSPCSAAPRPMPKMKSTSSPSRRTSRPGLCLPHLAATPGTSHSAQHHPPRRAAAPPRSTPR